MFHGESGMTNYTLTCRASDREVEKGEKTNLSGSVAGARNESAHVWRETETHDVACVTGEAAYLLARFDVP